MQIRQVCEACLGNIGTHSYFPAVRPSVAVRLCCDDGTHYSIAPANSV